MIPVPAKGLTRVLGVLVALVIADDGRSDSVSPATVETVDAD